MNTISTRRPLWPRLKARAHAFYLRREIKSFETQTEYMLDAIEQLPLDVDAVLGHVAQLRVKLALVERET